MTDESAENAQRTAPRTTVSRVDGADRPDEDPLDGTVGTATFDSAERECPVELLHVEPDRGAAEVAAAFFHWSLPTVRVRSVTRLADAASVVDAVDCVVTEHRLPDGTGVELVGRARERGVQTPVLFHTTCHDPLVRSRALDAGADVYVRKRSKRGQYDRLIAAVRAHARTRVGARAHPDRDSDRSRPQHAPGHATGSPVLPVRSEE